LNRYFSFQRPLQALHIDITGLGQRVHALAALAGGRGVVEIAFFKAQRGVQDGQIAWHCSSMLCKRNWVKVVFNTTFKGFS